MTASDRTFIKAYYHDEAEPALRPPHMGLPIHVNSHQQESSEPSESNELAGEPDPYAPEPWNEATSQEIGPHSENRAAYSAMAPQVEVDSGEPGEITEFVPAPHIPMTFAESFSSDGRKRTVLDIHVKEPSGSPPERKPLSSFAPEPPPRKDFSPALEVEGFRWSSCCTELLSEKTAAWQTVADRLNTLQAMQKTQVVAIASCWRGEGRTTALLCLANLLAQQSRASGQPGPALVDADFFHPDLARHLGLALKVGWEEVLRGEIALAEAVIASQDDGAILLPLRSSIERPVALCESLLAPVSLQVLREHASIVLVDLGPVLDQESAEAALTLAKETSIEATLLVTDSANTSKDDLAKASQQLAAVGAPVLGVIENFCSIPTIENRPNAISSGNPSRFELASTLGS